MKNEQTLSISNTVKKNAQKLEAKMRYKQQPLHDPNRNEINVVYL